MLVTISALIVAGTMAAHQSAGSSQTPDASAPVRQSAVAVSDRDSTRALRVAHRAQGDFESLRRQLLPRATFTGGADCDAVVGRYCFLQQVASDPPQGSARGRRGASSAPDGPRQSRRRDPRRSVDPRPDGSLSRRGGTRARGRQPGRRMRRISDGSRDEELVFRARRLHGAAVRQVSARRCRLLVGARRAARAGSLGDLKISHCSSDAPPDRTGAWTASRATR